MSDKTFLGTSAFIAGVVLGIYLLASMRFNILVEGNKDLYSKCVIQMSLGSYTNTKICLKKHI